jgi:protein-ribulosamine 3-kinase
MIPRPLQDAALRAVAVYDGGVARLSAVLPCGGGCINRAARLVLESGKTLFLKWNDNAPPGMFAAEARGLRLLRQAVEQGGVPLRVPLPVVHEERQDDCPAFILMEDVMSAPATPDPVAYGSRPTDSILAEGLAAIHRCSDEQFGLDHDNFIGPTPQPNRKMRSWAKFFIECRLRPMLGRLAERGSLSRRVESQAEQSLSNMTRILETVREAPSLVHGDLWGGNVLRTPCGLPALIDPAVYFGHREVDLAMTELFGGFSAAFREAYERLLPLEHGFATRRDIYNLYHILNHAVLFGDGYTAQAETILMRYA